MNKTRYYNSQHKKRELAKLWTLLSQLTTKWNLKKVKKKDKYLDFARKLKKTMEHEGDNYTNRDGCFWYSHQRINKGTGGHGNKRTNGDHPNYYIIENGQNTEKNTRDLRKLAVAQTPGKDHQLKLTWKTYYHYYYYSKIK